MKIPKIVVVLDGGLVQDIYTDTPVEVVTLDFDVESADNDELLRVPGIGESTPKAGKDGLANPACPGIRGDVEVDKKWVETVFEKVTDFLGKD